MAKARLARNSITVERLREVLDYDPATGIFRNRVKRSSNARIGDIAGTLHSKGYWQINVDGKLYLAHRLAWFYMTGKWPTIETDHDDLNKLNNKFENLRDATMSQNRANKAAQKNNTSGIKGVSWYKKNKKWIASIRLNRRQIYIGLFQTIDEAAAAYAKAASELFGEFART